MGLASGNSGGEEVERESKFKEKSCWDHTNLSPDVMKVTLNTAIPHSQRWKERRER